MMGHEDDKPQDANSARAQKAIADGLEQAIGAPATIEEAMMLEAAELLEVEIAALEDGGIEVGTVEVEITEFEDAGIEVESSEIESAEFEVEVFDADEE